LICVLIASIDAMSSRVPAAPEWLALVAWFSGLFTYAGIIVLGAPIYLGPLGAIVGVVFWLIDGL
jgi:hypothetical protein